MRLGHCLPLRGKQRLHSFFPSIMRIPPSMTGVALVINNRTSLSTDVAAQKLPTPTLQDKWTTAFPYHTPTANLIMLPFSASACSTDNMQLGLLREGMIGLGQCYPVSDSASFIWYATTDCHVTLHSGTNCEGWNWTPSMGECYDQMFGSFQAYC